MTEQAPDPETTADASESDLGPLPEPQVETHPEHHPGGVDAIEDDEAAEGEESGEHGSTPGEPTIPDLHPDDNPATDDTVPDEVTEPEDPETPTSEEERTQPEPPA